MSDRKETKRTYGPGLTAREVRFARLLFAGEQTMAACYLAAGFPAGPTPGATAQAASKLVKKGEFRTFYRELQDAAAEQAKVDAARVVRELARHAFFDIREVFDDRGRIRLPAEWSDAVAAGVLAVKSEELFEYVEEQPPPGPADPSAPKNRGPKARRKELVGYAREVKRVNPTEPLKVLAQILRLIGQDADAGKPPPAPLVIGGDANPDNL